jgi:hypothetical protein
MSGLATDRSPFRLRQREKLIFSGKMFPFIGISYLALRARREAAHQHDAVLPREPDHGATCGVVADNWTVPDQMDWAEVRGIDQTKVIAV